MLEQKGQSDEGGVVATEVAGAEEESVELSLNRRPRAAVATFEFLSLRGFECAGFCNFLKRYCRKALHSAMFAGVGTLFSIALLS